MMRDVNKRNLRSLIWRAGVLPGLIAAAIVGFLAYQLNWTYVRGIRECELFYMTGQDVLNTLNPYEMPAVCKDVQGLRVLAWSLGAFVLVAVIGLAAQALWPGWNDGTR